MLFRLNRKVHYHYGTGICFTGSNVMESINDAVLYIISFRMCVLIMVYVTRMNDFLCV